MSFVVHIYIIERSYQRKVLLKSYWPTKWLEHFIQPLLWFGIFKTSFI